MKVPPVLYRATREIIGEYRTDSWVAALDYMANELLDRWKLRFDLGAYSRACAGAARAEDVERARGRPGHPG